MGDDLSRWIQETVFSSYLEECQIFNELDDSYGFEYRFSQEFPSGDCSARKRKCSRGLCEDNSDSAGKQSRNGWQYLLACRHCCFINTLRTRKMHPENKSFQLGKVEISGVLKESAFMIHGRYSHAATEVEWSVLSDRGREDPDCSKLILIFLSNINV